MARVDRLTQIRNLLQDPIACPSDREAWKLVYHTLMYEVHQARQDRIQRVKENHGTYIYEALTLANFKHELNDL